MRAYVGLGSNLGDGPGLLALARAAIAALPGVSLVCASSIFHTEPQGRKDQPWFVNQVLALDCAESITADCLLESLQDIETAMGRVRDPEDHFGPRCIDLDLLLFGDETRNSSRLCLPHPRMRERAFVLLPLHEIAPGLILPGGHSVEELLAGLCYRLENDRIFQ